MSGICGFVNLDGAPADPALLQRMAQAAAYRAPDGIRYWLRANVGLAHLAFNLTPQAVQQPQPLLSADGNLALTAVVRLDNRPELLSALAAKGIVSAKDAEQQALSDAALILAAYQCWGEACPQYLLGDFAFVLWDQRLACLLAAVDPQGMEILHYRHQGAIFQFASDACQLLADPRFPADLDEETIARDLVLPNVGGQRESYYRGISKLAAAEKLLLNSQGRTVQTYWLYEPGQQIRYRREEEYAEHFLELFRQAVLCRLRSTRPIYLFASGGHDSLAVAALAATEIAALPLGSAPDFRAITLTSQAFPLTEELRCSRLVADRCRLALQEICVDDFPLLSTQPPFAPHRDEPGNTTFVSFITGAILTLSPGPVVYLTGLSGDAVVGVGNPFHYFDLLRAGRFGALHQTLRLHSQKLGVPYGWLVKNFLWAPLTDPLRRWLSQGRARFFPETSKMIPPWISPSLARRTALLDWARQQAHLDFFLLRRQPFDRNRAVDWRYRLLTDPRTYRLRRHLARLFAFWSGESWSPWDDLRLGQFALAVPPEQLTCGVDRKRILRRAMAAYLPPEVNERIRIKTGPEKWFEQGFTRPETWTQIEALLDKARIAEMDFVEIKPLRAELEQAHLGVKPISYRLWLALMLEIWLRLYIIWYN